SLQINSFSSISASPSLSFISPLAQIDPEQEPTPIGCPVFKELQNDPLAVLPCCKFLATQAARGRIIQTFPAASITDFTNLSAAFPAADTIPKGFCRSLPKKT
ncbi:MAG: hypothetical protein V5B39_16480, partial [Accumulibacter sp.]|uniref:hypothetical protein n=1 Tax=Accumulibacter sp. TaxID=2053492 RepID=UPI002FC2771A